MKSIALPEGTKVPDHIAMILDGNRRWARARGLQPWEGHRAGFEAVHKLAKAARQLGVHTFTVWAFSTENWERPEKELKEIFNVFRLALAQAEKEIPEEQVRFVQLGRKDRLPEDIRKRLARLEETSKQYTKNTFNVALDYGGRDEIVRAVNKILDARLKIIDAKIFESYLDTADQPYPNVDLFIRTSGEQRTSGLLPWQMDYAEYYFETDHLPDFSPEKLKEAILDFSRRRRRFGANDAEEHLKFDPKVVARLELDLRREMTLDLAIAYVKAQYGLSKDLAKSAGFHLLAALKDRRQEDLTEARKNLAELYEIVRKNLGLAFEPEIIANFEVGLWKDDSTEEDMKQYLAEKYRFSALQAAKSAHLAFLANAEVTKKNWDKAKWYMERFYTALKERVA